VENKLADQCLCDYSECEKSKECKRFMIRESTNPVYLKFYNICKEKNHWQYFIKMDTTEIIIKEESDTN